MEGLIQFLRRIFSAELVTVLLSALPISELRGAIQLALGRFHFPVYKAYLLAVMGNMIPVIPILLFLPLRFFCIV